MSAGVSDRPLAKELLSRLQQRALTDDDAAHECAVRYAQSVARVNSVRGDKYFNRVAAAYLAGLHGEPDPFRGGRGGNFVKPLVRAHRHGAALRTELQAD